MYTYICITEVGYTPYIHTCTCTYMYYSSFSLPAVPPVLSTSLAENQTVIYGDPLSLTCSVTNTPVTRWQWYHDGIPLPTPADETQFKVEATNNTHEGIYQCFAYNLAGNVSSTIHISVMSKPL